MAAHAIEPIDRWCEIADGRVVVGDRQIAVKLVSRNQRFAAHTVSKWHIIALEINSARYRQLCMAGT